MTDRKKILVVDDEERIRTLVGAYLAQEGYEVVTAADGRQALLAAEREHPDLVLLDVMMPEMDGLEFMRTYGKQHSAPVILLTARVEESDKVIGLELGADDYVTKPFSLRELAARVRTVLRRFAKTQSSGNALHAGDVVLDRDAFSVTVRGQTVDLTRTEFELLAVLMASPGKTLNRMHLLDQVQGVAFEGIERTIDGHVKNLRAKIEPNPREPLYIHTVYGVGYRFEAHLSQPE